MLPLHLALFIVLLIKSETLALYLGKRDSTLSLPQCLFDSPSGQVAAIVCSNQLNATQIEDACQTGTVPACIWTFDYQGSQATVCTKNATLVNQELQASNTSACVCGSTSSFSSGQSSVTIAGAPDSYSSEACSGGFCPLWYSSQPSYTCANGLPTLGDLSAATLGVIEAGSSSSQSGSALTGSATSAGSMAATTSASTVTRTASTASQQATSSGSTGSSSTSFGPRMAIPAGIVTFVLMAASVILYAH